MISIIVAVAENGVIGDKNSLLWHISEDLRNFKRITPTTKIPARIKLSEAAKGSAITSRRLPLYTVAATPILEPAPNQVASKVAAAIHNGSRRPATRKSPRFFTLRPEK